MKPVNMELFTNNAKDYEHGSASNIGILLLNLGTPAAPTAKALKPYLKEFLSDPRVIELWKPLWWFILHAFVLTKRPKNSAHAYKQIWTKDGSPLLVTTQKQGVALKRAIERRCGRPICLEIGMRYGNPSVESALLKLQQQGVRQMLMLPLYGQYAAATAGSCFDEVSRVLSTWRWVPELRTVMWFHDDPGYIHCLKKSIEDYWRQHGRGEKLVFSFHGIPQRYFDGGDPYYCHCQKTARLVTEALGLTKDEFIVCFQSRFGKEEWIKPYTDHTLVELAKNHVRRVDVICPGFIADCVETLEEIDIQNKQLFLEAGGRQLNYIPALNDRADFIDSLAKLAEKHLAGWLDNTYQQSSKKGYLDSANP